MADDREATLLEHIQEVSTAAETGERLRTMRRQGGLNSKGQNGFTNPGGASTCSDSIIRFQRAL